MEPQVLDNHTIYSMVPGAGDYPQGVLPPCHSSSILNDVKLFCNLTQEYKDFDHDLIALINGVLSILVQLGIVSPAAPLVHDDQLCWNAWIPDEARFGMVKLYVQAKVRLLFDPPSSHAYAEQLQSLVDEAEWRGFFEADIIRYTGGEY